MARFVAVLDRSEPRLAAELVAEACRVMAIGGSSESRREFVIGPFAVAALTHAGEPPIVRDGDRFGITIGSCPPAPNEAWLDALDGSTSRAPGRPDPIALLGRSCFLAWFAAREELALVTEPSGQLPIYIGHSRARIVLATEPKGVWAALPESRQLDPNALVELYTYGYCVSGRTLLARVRSAEPGALYRFGRDGSREQPIAPVESTRALAKATPSKLNAGLTAALERYRTITPHVTVALSGGMDSRYVLAGARGMWQDLDSFTFGASESLDVRLAEEVARTAGIRNQRMSTPPDFLRSWFGYATWRVDGLVNAIHAQGIDAVVAAASNGSCFVLNGMGGEFLMGAFLRPGHLTRRADPSRAAAVHARARRFHTHDLHAVFRPEVLSGATEDPGDALHALMSDEAQRLGSSGVPSDRLGHLLLSFWLRRYCARSTALGLVLESPWVEYIAPLVDPLFLAEVSPVTLHERFTTRAYAQALRELAPDLAAVRITRTGLAPRRPWPFHLAARAALGFGVLRRGTPAVDLAALVRHDVDWPGRILDSESARDRGFFLPEYLRCLIEAATGKPARRVPELGMAVTLELWRRMFLEGETGLAEPAIARGGEK